jgi:hypothetical protein
MTPELSTPQPPSKRKLAVTSAAALAVAIVLLATVVLPAEYGLDPLHTGALLGLTALSAPPVAKAVPIPAGATEYKPVQDGPIGYYNAAYKIDSAELKLGPYEYLEYKYRMEKDASMLFSWTASAAVTHHFHGDPGSGNGSEQSYDKKDRLSSSGTLVAPFAGMHGWFWENPSGEAITITVHSAGFYSAAMEFRSDRTRRAHELTSLKPSPERGKNESKTR